MEIGKYEDEPSQYTNLYLEWDCRGRETLEVRQMEIDVKRPCS
jgi:hypothetical protein